MILQIELNLDEERSYLKLGGEAWLRAELERAGPWPRERAIAWLVEQLSAGPRPAQELLNEGMALALEETTLKRAKAALGIRSERRGFGPGGRFWWHLPAQEQGNTP
jgi:hypothetical protein